MVTELKRLPYLLHQLFLPTFCQLFCSFLVSPLSTKIKSDVQVERENDVYLINVNLEI